MIHIKSYYLLYNLFITFFSRVIKFLCSFQLQSFSSTFNQTVKFFCIFITFSAPLNISFLPLKLLLIINVLFECSLNHLQYYPVKCKCILFKQFFFNSHNFHPNNQLFENIPKSFFTPLEQCMLSSLLFLLQSTKDITIISINTIFFNGIFETLLLCPIS